MKYIYECKGVLKQLQDHQETIVIQPGGAKIFCVICKDCYNPNTGVLHLLKRGEI